MSRSPTASSEALKIRSVCVFCGSKLGNHPEYRSAAEQLAVELWKRNIALIYGGGTAGIMGILAKKLLQLGGSVTGIIPEALIPTSDQLVGETVIVEDMHSRKALMNEKADAFIALPGGFGTMEELFEMTTWAQLNVHQKPVAVYNVRNYFTPIRQWIELSVREGFLGENQKNLMRIRDSLPELIDAIHQPLEKDSSSELNWKKNASVDV